MTPDSRSPVKDKPGFFHARDDSQAGADRAAGSAQSVSLLLRQVLHSRASEMAREGRYGEAWSLMNDATELFGQSSFSLDLLARMEAQRGNFLEAERLWKQALEMEPSNEIYLAALRRISALRRTVWARIAPAVAIAVIIAIAIVGTAIGVMSYAKKQVASVPLRAAPAADTVAAPILNIDLHDVSMKTQENQTVITFNQGLFSRNIRLTPEAKPVLTRLAQQLEPHAGRILIRVVGFSDSVPMPARGRYVDNATLAMGRALRVVEYMRRTSRLPAEMFSLEGHGETSAPYPNDSSENRLRNRTVVMRVSSRH